MTERASIAGLTGSLSEEFAGNVGSICSAREETSQPRIKCLMQDRTKTEEQSPVAQGRVRCDVLQTTLSGGREGEATIPTSFSDVPS